MKILVIEDDKEIRSHLVNGLVSSGHNVSYCEDGLSGLDHAIAESFDAIILDRMLPKLEGLSVLAAIRQEGVGTPVLILSSLGEVDDKIQGFERGADDYLTKPFSLRELEARLAALFRRSRGVSVSEPVITCADLELDLSSRKIKRGERSEELKTKEFQILHYLLQNQGQVITRSMILEYVWDYHFDPQTNVVDVHLSKLRKKVDGPGEKVLIKTVRSAGYKIES